MAKTIYKKWAIAPSPLNKHSTVISTILIDFQILLCIDEYHSETDANFYSRVSLSKNREMCFNEMYYN